MHQIMGEKVERKEVQVLDPLLREGCAKAEYLIDKESKTAFVEVANSAGLPMLRKEERDPWMACSVVSILTVV